MTEIKNLLSEFGIKNITTDSRKVKAGYAFFAMKGLVHDGNDFITKAIENGASLIFSDAKVNATQNNKIIYVDDIKGSLSEALNIIYPNLPQYIVGVTGTNGKTSVASYFRQFIEFVGQNAASIGTLGIECRDLNLNLNKYFDKEEYKNLTTLDQITMRKALNKLASGGINYVALEASSHGILQGRLKDIKLAAAAFTSFSQDHLDYHDTMDDYLCAKLSLFSANLENTGLAVINGQINEYEKIKDYLNKFGIKIFTVGAGSDINIKDINNDLQIQTISFKYNNEDYKFHTETVGSFQAYNILIALALVLQCGFDFNKTFKHIHLLKAPKGRLERVTDRSDSFHIFVDYAHTPDALEQSLKELLKIKNPRKGQLKVVFGCGGDRDKTKRGIMGKIAASFADEVIVTDDNPRSENPGSIRAQIMQGLKNAREIASREEAIRETIFTLNKGDILLIAGKGHEDYQIIGNVKTSFSDIEVAKKVLKCIK